MHRLSGAQAERRLALELHACRVRGVRRLIVITGRGYGNPKQQPLLRTRIEIWLGGAQAKLLGVLSFRRVHRDGALEVALAGPRPAEGEVHDDDEPDDEEDER